LREQSKIHDMSLSKDSNKRIDAVKQLGASFSVFTDRKQALLDLLRLCSDEDNEVRVEAVNSLAVAFPDVQDKEQVWERLVNLTAYPDEKVLVAAVNALVRVFKFMPDRNRAWKDLVGLANSESSLEDVSMEIISAFPDFIPEVPDKQQVWNDLLEMIDSNNHFIIDKAASFFCIVFPSLTDEGKEELWDKLLELATESGDMKVREQAVRALGAFFSEMPGEIRDEALDELLELTVSESPNVQKEVLLAIPSVFSNVKDKESAWKDLIRLTEDESMYIRKKAVDTLVSIFTEMPNKDVVWSDFLRLTRAKDEHVRNGAAHALKLMLPYGSNKDLFWKELIELAGDKDEYVRKTAFDILIKVFPYVSDKNSLYSDLLILAKKRDNYTLRELVTKLASDYPQFYAEYEMSERNSGDMRADKELRDKEKTEKFRPAGINEISSEKAVKLPEETVLSENADQKQDNWNEVLTMAKDIDMEIRRHASDLLSRVFSEVKTRPGVFFDLVKLTESQDAQIREKAAELFPFAFKYSDKKQRVWDELVRLTSAEDRKVRREAVLALSSGYADVPDKEKAWKDLAGLSDHSDNFVKRVATRALGNAFFLAPDKTEAWRDLQTISSSSYTYVRKYAFHSLGKASLWRSLKAENEVTFIFGIKEAVKYFKAAIEVPTDSSVPDFYQPFYEALLSVLFSEIPGIAKIESERYVSKLSHEIRIFGDSLQFYEIINQLSRLLRKAGELPKGDLLAQKRLLETSILAFEKFSSFLEIKEEEAISSPKTSKKEHSRPGKEILERVERKKSFLFKKL
jgi:HEAT repeat protein